MGDRHVYGARSRFMTRKVMARFEEISWSDEQAKNSFGTKISPVDVAGRLRGMWA